MDIENINILYKLYIIKEYIFKTYQKTLICKKPYGIYMLYYHFYTHICYFSLYIYMYIYIQEYIKPRRNYIII